MPGNLAQIFKVLRLEKLCAQTTTLGFMEWISARLGSTSESRRITICSPADRIATAASACPERRRSGSQAGGCPQR